MCRQANIRQTIDQVRRANNGWHHSCCKWCSWQYTEFYFSFSFYYYLFCTIINLFIFKFCILKMHGQLMLMDFLPLSQKLLVGTKLLMEWLGTLLWRLISFNYFISFQLISFYTILFYYIYLWLCKHLDAWGIPDYNSTNLWSYFTRVENATEAGYLKFIVFVIRKLLFFEITFVINIIFISFYFDVQYIWKWSQ